MRMSSCILAHRGNVADVVEGIEASKAAELIGREGVVVLDVRTAREFTAVRIAGASNADWNRADFVASIEHLDRTAPTVLYCRTGQRSNEAMQLMDRLGFAELYDVGGGIIASHQAGHPREQGSARQE
jgi:rhodanese-related sulfurtransferase